MRFINHIVNGSPGEGNKATAMCGKIIVFRSAIRRGKRHLFTCANCTDVLIAEYVQDNEAYRDMTHRFDEVYDILTRKGPALADD